MMFNKKDPVTGSYKQSMRNLIHKIMVHVPDTSLVDKTPLHMATMKKGNAALTFILLEEGQIAYKIEVSQKTSFQYKANVKENYWKIGSVHSIVEELKGY